MKNVLDAITGMITLIHQVTEDKRIPEDVRKEYLKKFNKTIKEAGSSKQASVKDAFIMPFFHDLKALKNKHE